MKRLTSKGSKYKQYAAKTAVITGGLQVDYTYSNDSYVSSQIVTRVAVMRTMTDFVNRIIDKVSDTWHSATGWLRGGAKSTAAAEVYLPKPKPTFAKNIGDTIDRRWLDGYGRIYNSSSSMRICFLFFHCLDSCRLEDRGFHSLCFLSVENSK
jgi:hypothetical protein